MENNEEKALQPHHIQESLCTTRLPYRQGRKLTAVKAYSITKESNHLLIFGVPSLNLRQETKSLFIKFGKLIQFTISTAHPSESFTDTYHAQFERIQSARLAKRMLDAKNYYGGVLHICYAPELESIEETKRKIFQRKYDVTSRLRNLDKEFKCDKKDEIVVEDRPEVKNKINMGEVNVIMTGNKKRKLESEFKKLKVFKKEKRQNIPEIDRATSSKNTFINVASKNRDNNEKKIHNIPKDIIEIVDCTSVDKDTITNINEHLNFDKFGTEIVKKVASKPLNKIQFHFNKS